MLFMLVVKASKYSEAGNLPSSELVEAVTKYNEELVKAGVRVMAKGFHPSSLALFLTSYKTFIKDIFGYTFNNLRA